MARIITGGVERGELLGVLTDAGATEGGEPAALVAAVPASWMAAGAWRATIRNEKRLTTDNGTTTAQYTEQTYNLLNTVAARQNEISKQLENHIVDNRIHTRETT